jgi:hypothetical protein
MNYVCLLLQIFHSFAIGHRHQEWLAFVYTEDDSQTISFQLKLYLRSDHSWMNGRPYIFFSATGSLATQIIEHSNSLSFYSSGLHASHYIFTDEMYKHPNERQIRPCSELPQWISSRTYLFLGQFAVSAQESTHSRNKSKDRKIWSPWTADPGRRDQRLESINRSIRWFRKIVLYLGDGRLEAYYLWKPSLVATWKEVWSEGADIQTVSS